MESSKSSSLKLIKKQPYPYVFKVFLPDGSHIGVPASDEMSVRKDLFSRDESLKMMILEVKAVQVAAKYESLGEFENVVVIAPTPENPFWKKEAWHFICIKDGDKINHNQVIFIPEKWRNGQKVDDAGNQKFICRNFFAPDSSLEKENLNGFSPAMAGKHLLADVSVQKKSDHQGAESLTLNIRVKKVFEATDQAKFFLAQPSYQKTDNGASIPIPGTKKFISFLTYRPDRAKKG